MNDKDIRMECLRLALGCHGYQRVALERAHAYYIFVTEPARFDEWVDRWAAEQAAPPANAQ